jgi:2OG-Fe(II) oxygenase superfamily
MIQLTRSGLAASRDVIPALYAEFQATHCIRLRELLHPDLLSFLAERLTAGTWSERVHGEIAVEDVLDDIPARSLLHFLVNNRGFRCLVQEITGCGPLTTFGGRVYRLTPNSGHYDSWHDDTQGDRLVGMSVNLSLSSYSGGLFQLRERASGRMLAEIANTGLGDAILFRISKKLEHCVSEVEGDVPKTAFAGWFQGSEKDFFSEARDNLRKIQ